MTTVLIAFLFLCSKLAALGMAKATQHRPVDAVLPDVQKAAVPVGSASGPPGQLQGRAGPGHGAEETVPQGGEML